ncbi:hypothetical protein [Clostridium sp. LP20]|uniref:hypothetical protein n=1 Tax=Clostridium sp. LP20 TaxID=3418665 RepID=UPI003EE5180B
MNCHGDKKGNQKHSSLKHMLHMVLCCGLPILIVGLLPLVSKVSTNAGRVLSIIAPFICPIMMVFMILMMIRGNKESRCCDNSKQDTNNRDV